MYTLQPAQHDNLLFFRLEGEAAERYGAIGHLRVDFSKSGREFHCTWFDKQPHLKTPAFKAEFDSVINSLRDVGERPPFASRENLATFCSGTPGKELTTTQGGGYMVRTQDFSYYFRCKPSASDYDVYCFTFDNRYLLPELAGQHELPDMCYSTLPSNGDIIIIKCGERGNYRCEYTTNDTEYNREFASDRNIKLGVTRAQEEAMLAGSMFGWNTPAAKPWHYNMDGTPRPMLQKKNEPER